MHKLICLQIILHEKSYLTIFSMLPFTILLGTNVWINIFERMRYIYLHQILLCLLTEKKKLNLYLYLDIFLVLLS